MLKYANPVRTVYILLLNSPKNNYTELLIPQKEALFGALYRTIG